MRLKRIVSDNIKMGISELECERCALISLMIWTADELRKRP